MVQSLVVKRFVKRFGERTAAITGYAATAIGFLIYASAPTGLLFPLGMPFYALAGLVGPAVQSQMTRQIAPTEQGRLQGTIAGLASLCGLFAPIMFTQVFGFATEHARGGLVPPGLHLYLGAAILLGGAGMAAAFMRRKAAPA